MMLLIYIYHHPKYEPLSNNRVGKGRTLLQPVVARVVQVSLEMRVSRDGLRPRGSTLIHITTESKRDTHLI